MYFISLHYIATLEQVDALIPAHVEWLNAAYAEGCFLASGRKVPRTGGAILAVNMPRERLDALLATDPFYTGGVAEYQVTEFSPGMAHPDLQHWIGQ
ncbi:YciI family protein [Leeia aquatica]|uniref:YCII-related domain-containing protein n=1 Tax=Leeia aquatica TaxID=2725557 RepID=A0A847SDD3_9NEIS|nr:YciI family protein [Leeia aquatica]NLR75178.1 hypothetical protein [Leeia aquatica]